MPGTTDRTRSERVGHWLAPLLWLVGLAGLPVGHYFLINRIDPFYPAVYTFLWVPYILTVDLLVYLLRGKSLLRNRPWEMLLLALWSTPVWLLFEAINLRLQNWYYINVPLFPRRESWMLLPAFATVLPALFETTELVMGVIERFTDGKGIQGQPSRITRRKLDFMLLLGVVMLALTLVWPGIFFCLTWGFAFFLLDPLCYRKRGPSLIGQLAYGEHTRFVSLIAAGVICGGLWEAWNVWAGSKWVYTVPGFSWLKIGEMPLLGFLGFPAFTLECYAIVNALSLLRGGRHWERTARQNARRTGMPPRRVTWLWCGVLCASLVVYAGVFQRTVSSYETTLWRILHGSFPRASFVALRKQDIVFPRQFLAHYDTVFAGMRAARNPDAPAPIPILTQADAQRLYNLCRIASLRGIGLHYAVMLEALEIETPQQLAGQTPGDLAARLTRMSEHMVVPPVRRVRVWIDAAKKYEKIGHPSHNEKAAPVLRTEAAE